jgi:hypothetical protein
MKPNGALRAWIERCGDRFIAAFVGQYAVTRAPATRVCATQDEARGWVEVEAALLGVSVDWVGGPAST